MKKVVVNDTNVFIDLFDVGLLEGLFSLPWEVHTTELVMLELQREGEAETVNRYKEEGRLHVPVFSPKEMMQIVALLPPGQESLRHFHHRLLCMVLCQEKQLRPADWRQETSQGFRE